MIWGEIVKKLAFCFFAVVVLAALVAAALPEPASAVTPLPVLEQRVIDLEEEVATLTVAVQTLTTSLAAVQANNALKLGPYVDVSTDPLQGLKGPHVLFTGANVHVRSGSGLTAYLPVNGLGNLIVGYNELYSSGAVRTGSHNLVVGPLHTYTDHSSFVTGTSNEVGRYAMAGGLHNRATGQWSSAVGGYSNQASGYGSAVGGGHNNEASGTYSSVSGGASRVASEWYQWVAGSLSEAR